MSTWNTVTIEGMTAAGLKRKKLPDFDLFERSTGGNGWDTAWIAPNGHSPEELKALRKDSVSMDGQTKWRAEDIGEWIVTFTAEHPEITITWSQQWDDDEPGSSVEVYRKGELVRDESQVSGMLPMDWAELVNQGKEALAHLERTADGDSNDAEIEAGQRVADILRTLIEGINQ